MTYLESIVLGIIQGISEFLPISSSGHLVVVRRLMELSDIPLLFDVLMHVPTLLAIVVVFRRRIGALIAALYRLLSGKVKEEDGGNLRLLRSLLIATAATAIVGFAIERLQSRFPVSPKMVGVLFLFTAAVLVSTRFFHGKRRKGELTAGTSLLIGSAQGLGVLAGISRSGITLSASLACGTDREQAGEYAFLLAIPAVIGALILEIPDIGSVGVGAGALAAGMLCSFAVGLGSLLLLLRLIRKGRLYLFAIYLVPVGVATLLLL